MKRELWNRCCYCGKMIAYSDFLNYPNKPKAYNKLITPESLYTKETFEAFHVKCYEINKNNESSNRR